MFRGDAVALGAGAGTLTLLALAGVSDKWSTSCGFSLLVLQVIVCLASLAFILGYAVAQRFRHISHRASQRALVCMAVLVLLLSAHAALLLKTSCMGTLRVFAAIHTCVMWIWAALVYWALFWQLFDAAHVFDARSRRSAAASGPEHSMTPARVLEGIGNVMVGAFTVVVASLSLSRAAASDRACRQLGVASTLAGAGLLVQGVGTLVVSNRAVARWLSVDKKFFAHAVPLYSSVACLGTLCVAGYSLLQSACAQMFLFSVLATSVLLCFFFVLAPLLRFTVLAFEPRHVEISWHFVPLSFVASTSASAAIAYELGLLWTRFSLRVDALYCLTLVLPNVSLAMPKPPH